MTPQGAVAKAKSEVNEVARLRTRIQELEAEVHQLNHEKLALQSKVDELRARVSGMCRRPAHRAPPKSERCDSLSIRAARRNVTSVGSKR